MELKLSDLLKHLSGHHDDKDRKIKKKVLLTPELQELYKKIEDMRKQEQELMNRRKVFCDKF